MVQINLVGPLRPGSSWEGLSEGPVRGGRQPLLPLFTRGWSLITPSTADCPGGCHRCPPGLWLIETLEVLRRWQYADRREEKKSFYKNKILEK